MLNIGSIGRLIHLLEINFEALKFLSLQCFLIGFNWWREYG